MRIVIGSLFFILAVFPHYIELVSPPVSPERTRENVHAGGEPSSSGRRSTTNVVIHGSIWPSRHGSLPRSVAAPETSGLRRDKHYQTAFPIEGLFCDVNGHRVPFGHGNAGCTQHGYLFGTVSNGILRPIYNQNGEIVMVRIVDHQQFVITMEEAEQKLGMNKPIHSMHLHPQ